jgi:hypothetical protein
MPFFTSVSFRWTIVTPLKHVQLVTGSQTKSFCPGKIKFWTKLHQPIAAGEKI